MKNSFKKICASLLAAIMVFTYMPVFGLGAVYATSYDYTPAASVKVPDQQWTGDYPDLNEVDALAKITTTTGVELVRGVDFTVESSEAAAGESEAVFTGINKYENKTIAPIKFMIVEDVTNTYEATIDPTSKFLQYDGDELEAENAAAAITLTKNGKTRLRYGQDTDYKITVAPLNNAVGNAGDHYKVTVSVLDPKDATAPLFTKDFDVEITKHDLSRHDVTITVANQKYEARALEPTVAVSFTGTTPTEPETLSPETDYVVTYGNNTNVTKKAYAEVTAKSTSKNFTGSKKSYFEISQYDMVSDGVDVRTLPKQVAYTGKLNNPQLDMKVYFVGTDREIPASDYEVVYGETINASDGIYKISIAPSTSGNLKGMKTEVDGYQIVPASLKGVTVTQKADVPYGTKIAGSAGATNFNKYFDVDLNGVKVAAGPDFVAASDGVDFVKKELVLEAGNSGNFDSKDTKKVSFTSTAGMLAERYYSTADFDYNGKAFTPDSDRLGTIYLDDNGAYTEECATELKPGEYEVLSGTYKNNTNASHAPEYATATIRGKGDYSGRTATVEFEIDTKTLHREYGFTVTGLTSGKYYVGQPLTGINVTASDGVNTVNFEATDYVATVETITSSGLLTEVKVTPSKSTGNYGFRKRVVDVTPVSTERFDFTDATLTDDTVPAGLVDDAYSDGLNNQYLKKYLTVTTAEGVEIDSNAYTLDVTGVGTGVEPQNRGKASTTLNVTITPVPGKRINGEARNFTLKVEPRDIKDLEKYVVVDPYTYDHDYDGTEKKPKIYEFGAPEDTKELSDGIDYTLTYADNVNAGKATVTVTGKGSYTGKFTKTFEILPTNLSQTLYNGKFMLAPVDPAKTQFAVGAPADLSSELTIVPNSDAVKYVISKDDYEITMNEKPVRLGTAASTKREVSRNDSIGAPIWIEYTATVKKGSKNYVAGDTFTVKYKLTPMNVASSTVTLEKGNKVSYQNPPRPGSDGIKDYPYPNRIKRELGEITVKVGGITLTEGTDYTYSFEGSGDGSGKLASDLKEGDVVPYVDVEFMGNYAGSNTSTKLEVVENKIDLSQVKLIAPTTGELTYKDNRTIKYVDNTKGRFPQRGWAVEITKDGEALNPGRESAGGDYWVGSDGIHIYNPDVGDYTMTVVPRKHYASDAEGDSISFTIVPQKLNASKFKEKVEELSAVGYDDSRFISDIEDIYLTPEVEYLGSATKTPALIKGKLDHSQWVNLDSAIFDKNFEVIDYSTTWDGKDTTKGTATIALKYGANYIYDGEAEIPFDWRAGRFNGEDVNDFFYIPDQAYTGSAVEPFVELYDGIDEELLGWVTYDSFENNTSKGSMSAKANITVQVPEDYTGSKYVPGSWMTGTILFGIVTDEEAAEAAVEAIDAASAIDSTYPADAKKAVDEAADALQELLDGSGTTNQITKATKKLNDAILNAEKAKANATIAEANKITADVYKAASVSDVAAKVKAVNDAIATNDGAKIKAATDDLAKAVKAAAKKDASKFVAKKAKKTLKAKANKKTVFKAKKAFKISGKAGTVSYKKVKLNKKKYNKYFKVSSSGKVTVKKGVKKGTYKLKVQVTDSGNGNVLGATQNVTLKIKVK